jgi:tRNA C32,U32 (ribose-2'-O)-methylase TrmJ
MDNVQNCDSYINIPSSQTYRSYSLSKLILIWIVSLMLLGMCGDVIPHIWLSELEELYGQTVTVERVKEHSNRTLMIA